MSAKHSPFFAAIFVLITFAISNGEISTAFNLGGGYNGNLFRDSLATEDSYSSFGGHINFYPSSSVQVSGFGQYSAYKTNNELSNIFGGGSIHIIPTSELSPVTVIFSGELSGQGYGGSYQLYNQNNFSTDALIVYNLSSKFHIRLFHI